MATIDLGRVGFVNKGAYSGIFAYKLNDVVVYNSGTYACIQANTGQLPTATAYWQVWVSNDKAPLDSPALVNPTINGVAQSGYSGFKNYIINGGFDVWQRGTSQTAVGYGSADRWYVYSSGTPVTASRQVGNTGHNYCISSAGVAGNTDVAYIQNIESLNAKQFSTSSGILSFWVYSDISRTSKIAIKYPNTADIFTTTTAVILQDVTFITGWNKYTLSIPSNTNYSKGMQVSIGGYGMALTSGNFGLAQVQLEEGSVATPFEQRPYGLELSLCQRYYEVWQANSSRPMIGIYNQNGTAYFPVQTFKVIKRVSPTCSVSSTSTNLMYGGGSYGAYTALAVNAVFNSGFRLQTTGGQSSSPVSFVDTIITVTASAEL